MAEATDLKSVKCGFKSHLGYVTEHENRSEVLFDLWNRCRGDIGWAEWTDRKKFIPGEGNLTADIVFVGEAPGKQEDIAGKPFVGPSGKYLDSLINDILDLTREDVYTTNVVKFRPTDAFGNRPPTLQEKYTFTPYLIEEILIINPKIIVPLGNHALNVFFPHEKISKVRGKCVTKPLREKEYKFTPTYHPSYVLRQSKEGEKSRAESLIEKDFDMIKQILNSLNKGDSQ